MVQPGAYPTRVPAGVPGGSAQGPINYALRPTEKLSPLSSLNPQHSLAKGGQRYDSEGMYPTGNSNTDDVLGIFCSGIGGLG